MRLIGLIIILLLLVVFPTVVLWLRFLPLGFGIVVRVLSLVAPVALLGGMAFEHETSGNMRVIQWLLWVFMLIYLPLSIYAIGVSVDYLTGFFVCNRHIVEKIFGGIAIAVVVGLCVGVVRRNHISIRRITIESPNLPASFDGVKIAHLTDMHLGTLTPKRRQLDRLVDSLSTLAPDMLCFTGDMVNQCAKEGDGLPALFLKVKAPLGRYAVMGNHDYGDYYSFDSIKDKTDNLAATHLLFKRLGFRLLLDSALYIERGGASIGLIGVENCTARHFHNYGNLSKAVDGWTPADFNILLSHDPTHWTETVTNGNFDFIDLTLSGHTHGAQVGLSSKWLSFSPAQWVYPLFDGGYSRRNQHLVISHGIGYVGIPFRLGMSAEIVLITLKAGSVD